MGWPSMENPRYSFALNEKQVTASKSQLPTTIADLRSFTNMRMQKKLNPMPGQPLKVTCLVGPDEEWRVLDSDESLKGFWEGMPSTGVKMRIEVANEADSTASGSDAEGLAAAVLAPATVTSVNFWINDFFVEKDICDLPRTIAQVKSLAQLVPNSSELPIRVRITAFIGNLGQPQDLIGLTDENVEGFWRSVAEGKYSGKQIKIEVTGELKTKAQSQSWFGKNKAFFYVLGIVTFCLTGSGAYLPPDLRLAVLPLKLAKGAAASIPGLQSSASGSAESKMKNYAVAAVSEFDQQSDQATMLLEKAQSYANFDLLRTDSTNKKKAVEFAFQDAGIPENLTKSILGLVETSSDLQKHVQKFVLDENGRAVLYIVNLWMVTLSDSKVEVALMLCGAEFTKAKETENFVEQIVYASTETRTPHWSPFCGGPGSRSRWRSIP